MTNAEEEVPEMDLTEIPEEEESAEQLPVKETAPEQEAICSGWGR